MDYKAGDDCPCCGCKMTAVQAKSCTSYDAGEMEDEVEVSIEGSADSVRSVLEKLIPK